MWMMLFVVAMSILTLSLGTVKDFRVVLNACQYRDHLLDLSRQTKEGNPHYYGSAITLMKNVSCDISMKEVRKKAEGMHQYISNNFISGTNNYRDSNSTSNFNNAKFGNTSGKHSSRNSDKHLDYGGYGENYDQYYDLYNYYRELVDTFLYDYYQYYDDELEDSKLVLDMIASIKNLRDITKRHDVLTYLDIALVIIFTFEMILRLATCPNYKRFCVDWLNILDVLLLILAYAGLVLEFRFAKYRYKEKGFKIFIYLQMLRVLRVMRYIQHVPAVLVLTHTLRTNFRDLGVLIFFILMGVLIFGNFAFFAEDNTKFVNIPTSWWWSLITMTTVGYGDVVPKTVLGKIVGCLCALSGVICLSLTIPVFVNTFISLYKFSNIYEKRLRRKSAKVHPSARKYAKDMPPGKDTSLPALNATRKGKSFRKASDISV